MSTVLKWLLSLDDEAVVRSIALGETEWPQIDGHAESSERNFFQLMSAAIDIYRGEFESAAGLLAGCSEKANLFWCNDLIKLWYEAETGEPEQAVKKINLWLEQHPQAKIRRKNPFRPLIALDRRLAGRWAPVLHCYVASLLNQWSEKTLAQIRLSRETAAVAGISENLLIRLDFLLRFAQARSARSIGQILTAVNEWDALCRQDATLGDGTEYILEAVVALEFEERFDEALTWLQRGLDKEPRHYDFLLVKARILKHIGEMKSCIETCNRLIEYYPSDFSGYCLRSNAHFLMGLLEQAMADAQSAVEVAPENPNSLMARAFARMQSGNYEAALTDFEQALRYDPQRYDALRGQGKCQSMLGRDYDALASFNALRRIYPDDPELYYELADTLLSAGYLDDCAKVCRKCLELDEDHANAYVILAMVAVRRGDDEKAGQLLHQALRLEPDNPFALNELAYLKHLQGEDDLALELIDRVLEEAPDYADALCNKGVIHYFRSEFEESAAAFNDALCLASDHVAALVGKGNALTQLCEFDAALVCYDQALAKDPRNIDACHGKAILYRMLGLDDEVRRWQDQACSLEDDLDGFKY
ncbi:MAG: tetratricopeptide repeat protein [Saccharofermentanales bacterium]|jgi:tetratricopeptide (TPR) repeat protein|nr:tetratricopeptide repeat protein [Clostridiaceae bacterium]